jgi:multidrug efflux pump subunit AcrA (membrane-fusion protein)
VDSKVGEVVGASSPSLGGAGGSSSAAGSSDAEGADAGAGGSATGASSAGSAGAGSGTVIALTQLEGLEVQAGFSETDAARVSPGDTARISVDALPGQEFAAHVVEIDPEETLVDNVVTYDVTFFLDTPQGPLKPGMTATTDVIVEESDEVLAVPKPAVRSPAGSSPTATVVHADGRQEARLLVTGLEGDSSVEVVGGLGEGEQVVVPGAAPPADG